MMATESLQHFIDTLKSKLANERAENARLQEQVDTATETGLRVMKERDALQARAEEAEKHDCGMALTKALEIAERQLALAERCKEELRAVEWQLGFADSNHLAQCPSCCGTEPEHNKRCTLAAAIEEEGE